MVGFQQFPTVHDCTRLLKLVEIRAAGSSWFYELDLTLVAAGGGSNLWTYISVHMHWMATDAGRQASSWNRVPGCWILIISNAWPAVAGCRSAPEVPRSR